MNFASSSNRNVFQFSTWFVNEGKQGLVSDIALESFMEFLSDSSDVEVSSELLDVSPAPVTESSFLLKQMLCRCPGNFVDDASISTLRGTFFHTLCESVSAKPYTFAAHSSLLCYNRDVDGDGGSYTYTRVQKGCI